MKPEDFERSLIAAKQGAAAEQALENLSPHLAAERARIEREVFSKIATGTLTADYAYAAWVELHAAHRLVMSLTKKAKRGRGASRRIEPQMNSQRKGA